MGRAVTNISDMIEGVRIVCGHVLLESEKNWHSMRKSTGERREQPGHGHDEGKIQRF